MRDGSVLSRNAATVAIVGLGYVGLPTALAFLAAGARVIGFDRSADRIADIRAENVDLLADDRARLRRFVDTDGFALTTDARPVADADVVIVCVPTPIDSHMVPDLDCLTTACRSVVRHARAGQTIILTSTSYPGCTRDLLVRPFGERGFLVGRDVFVAFSGERIDPGNAVNVLATTPRVVGGATEACTDSAADVLRQVAPDVHRVGSPETAEMAKLLENTFRAVNIALANEFADACAQLGVDVVEVVSAAATKPYGFMPFYPGPGVGGHCIPCDPHYLLWQMRADRIAMPLVETAMGAIAARPRRVVARVGELLAETGRALDGARVLVVGVTYKPDVADCRESPALEIISRLLAAGTDVHFSDPLVPTLTIRGRCLHSVDEPWRHDWDIVVVQAMHSDSDTPQRLVEHNVVLDATYRMATTSKRPTL